jgi:serine/threonine protein kinase
MKKSSDFQIISEIGSGSFSKVYKAKDLVSGKLFALKIATRSSSLLRIESQTLSDLSCFRYFPKLKHCGTIESSFFFSMTLFGPSLLSLAFDGRIKRSHIFRYLKRLVKALKCLHSKGYVHQDIKPGNICVSRKNNKDAFLIDLGFAERIVDPKTGCFKPMQVKNSFKGNYAFCSDNVLFGVTPSKRDDLESLAYVAAYLLQGELPWAIEPLKESKMHAQRQVLLTKLMEGLPQGLNDWIRYCKSLKYDQKPDYGRITHMIDLCKEETKKAMSESMNCRVQRNLKTKVNSECPTERASLPEITKSIKEKSKRFIEQSNAIQQSFS